MINIWAVMTICCQDRKGQNAEPDAKERDASFLSVTLFGYSWKYKKVLWDNPKEHSEANL